MPKAKADQVVLVKARKCKLQKKYYTLPFLDTYNISTI